MTNLNCICRLLRDRVTPPTASVCRRPFRPRRDERENRRPTPRRLDLQRRERGKCDFLHFFKRFPGYDPALTASFGARACLLRAASPVVRVASFTPLFLLYEPRIANMAAAPLSAVKCTTLNVFCSLLLVPAVPVKLSGGGLAPKTQSHLCSP